MLSRLQVRRPTCSCHNLPLGGGGAVFWCSVTGSTVFAADVSIEYVAVTR